MLQTLHIHPKVEKTLDQMKTLDNAPKIAPKQAEAIINTLKNGTTMARAARSCREQGVETVFAAATHGLFTEGSEEVVEDPAIDQFFVTSSVPPFRLPKELVQKKVTVLDIAPLFAESIRRLHEGGSIIELLREPE